MLINPKELALKFIEVTHEILNHNFSAIQEFQTALLNNTLKHAKKYSLYYRNILPDLAKKKYVSLFDMNKIPLLDKKDIINNFSLLQTSKNEGIIQYTSGTTGTPIAIYRTNEEIQFLKNFYSHLRKFLYPDNKSKPLILNLINYYHGYGIDLPFHGYRLNTGIYDIVLIRQIKHWLTSQHNIPGIENHISIITGLYHFVEWLTYFLLKEKFNFDLCKLKTIYTIGGYLTSRWQNLLKKTWNAKVISIYSMTEIFTYSNQCQFCQGFHFLPNVIPELICPIKKTAVNNINIGELVLTGLYPFVQGLPIIRYATRDLFKLKKGNCEMGDSYIFQGRLNDSLIIKNSINSSAIVIGNAVIQDILDDEPHIYRNSIMNELFDINCSIVGKPKFSLEKTEKNGFPRIYIKIQLNCEHYLYQNYITQLRKKILKKIRNKIPELDKYLKERKCEMQILFYS